MNVQELFEEALLENNIQVGTKAEQLVRETETRYREMVGDKVDEEERQRREEFEALKKKIADCKRQIKMCDKQRLKGPRAVERNKKLHDKKIRLRQKIAECELQIKDLQLEAEGAKRFAEDKTPILEEKTVEDRKSSFLSQFSK